MNLGNEIHILYAECYEDNSIKNQCESHVLYKECYASKKLNRKNIAKERI